MRRAFVFVVLAVIAVSSSASEKFHRQTKRVPNRYIVEVAVKQKLVIRNLANTLPQRHGGRLVEVFDDVLGGFVAEMAEQQAILLSAHPEIAGVYEVPVGEPTSTEAAASWGRDRIDQRYLPLDGLYMYHYYASNVTTYVIDTGVHLVGDLVGRVALRHDVTDTNLDDCRQAWPYNGHGTQVASTIGGSTYGAAKSVILISVKAHGCTTTTIGSDRVISALDWIVKRRQKEENAGELSVANISLEFSQDDALDAAVRDAIGSGVTVVVGAGNSGIDACSMSPSRTGDPTKIVNNPNGYSAITVGATDGEDQIARFSDTQSSNTGACVDIFAPGLGLTATGVRSIDSNFSGTSAASPHVAAVAAMTHARYGAVSPGMIETYILQNATPDMVKNNPLLTAPLAGTSRKLLYQIWAPKQRSCCS